LLFALPSETGKFRKVKSGSTVSVPNVLVPVAPPVASDLAEYVDSDGQRFVVEQIQFRGDGEAYEFFSLLAADVRKTEPGVEIGTAIGTAEFSRPNQLAFFKGAHLVRITSVKPLADSKGLNALAQSLDETIEKGDGDIPVLIQHLPNPDQAQKTAIYLNAFDSLENLAPQQLVLNAVKGDGNADAAFAAFGPSKVLVVEFNTPQLATENDKRIVARIQELWKLGQPAPTAYKRVGNYSVFVFDAPDDQTAKQLIEQVHYEQVVSWLGENPNILRRAEERYINTTLGVLVTVLKASGYALIGCLGIGGLIGGLLFSYRRSQQKATAYSDAGGMMRLNLDEMTADRRR
jgi:hypothetical protein